MRLGLAPLALGLVVAGCAGEGGLRIVVESRGLDGDRGVDALSLRVVASQTPDTEHAYTCRSFTTSLEAPDGELLDFPVTIVVHPGEVLWRCVAIRAVGHRDDREVLRAEELFCPDLDEVTEERIRLDATCHVDSAPTCQAGEVCRPSGDAATCEPSRVGSIFSVNPFIDAECHEPLD